MKPLTPEQTIIGGLIITVLTSILTYALTPVVKDFLDPSYLAKEVCREQGTDLLLYSKEVVVCYGTEGIKIQEAICNLWNPGKEAYCKEQRHRMIYEKKT